MPEEIPYPDGSCKRPVKLASQASFFLESKPDTGSEVSYHTILNRFLLKNETMPTHMESRPVKF